MRIKFKSTVQGIKCTMKIAVAVAAVALSFGVIKDTAWAESATEATTSPYTTTPITTQTTDKTGYEGGIKWTIDDDTLTIEPAESDKTTGGIAVGAMKTYDAFPGQWETKSGYPAWGGTSAYDSVKKIVIKDGVTNISEKAFGTNPSATAARVFESVTVGANVTSIGSLAFFNDTVQNLTVYSTVLDSIADDSFEDNITNKLNLTLGVGTVKCFIGDVSEYFSKFTKDDTSVVVNGTSYAGTYLKSGVNVNTSAFNVTVTSYNLLGTGDEVFVKWGGTSNTITASVSKDKYDLSFSTATQFISAAKSIYADDNEMTGTANTDTKNFKFFDLSATDSYLNNNSAQITIPTPSDWSEDFGNIWVLVRTEKDGVYTYDRLESTNTASTIVFTAPHFSPYALYYAGSGTTSSGTDSSGSDNSSSSDTATNENCEISITTDYFSSQFFKWGIGSITDGVYGIPTVSSTDDILKKFATANSNNDQGYTVDTTHLKAFDLSSTINDEDNTEKIANLKVRVPIPSEWNNSRSKVQVLTIADNGKIEVVNDPGIYETNGTYYIEFTPPHFSPYALYLADTSDVTSTATTAATTTAAATTKATTTAAATTKATTAASTTKATTKASGSGAQLDNTPGTGVKDFMWIAVPIAVMLMGVGIVFLARRNKKDLDD